MRDRAGVLTGYALGEAEVAEKRDVLADVAAVFGTDKGLRTLYPIGPNGEANPSAEDIVVALGIAPYVAGAGAVITLVSPSPGRTRQGLRRTRRDNGRSPSRMSAHRRRHRPQPGAVFHSSVPGHPTFYLLSTTRGAQPAMREGPGGQLEAERPRAARDAPQPALWRRRAVKMSVVARGAPS